MKTPVKVTMKVQRIDRFFLMEVCGGTLVAPVREHRKCQISMYFLRKGKNMFSGKKIPSLQMIQERSCAGGALLGKTIFSEESKKISYFHLFFLRKIIFHFSPKV